MDKICRNLRSFIVQNIRIYSDFFLFGFLYNQNASRASRKEGLKTGRKQNIGLNSSHKTLGFSLWLCTRRAFQLFSKSVWSG